jgi:hypothetical protein
METNAHISNIPFRHRAGFGKRIEHYLISLMLKEGFDIFIPMVDDDAIDAVVKRPDGKYVELQIKARSKDVRDGDAAMFAAIRHEYRENYWFVFYSERLDTILILSSKEFIAESAENTTGENIGKRAIWFNGRKDGKEYIKPQFQKYIAKDFSRILSDEA